jgi:hypothetical protein
MFFFGLVSDAQPRPLLLLRFRCYWNPIPLNDSSMSYASLAISHSLVTPKPHRRNSWQSTQHRDE